MFCGRFSTSGEVLLTASQEAVIKLYDAEAVYQWSAKGPGNKRYSLHQPMANPVWFLRIKSNTQPETHPQKG